MIKLTKVQAEAVAKKIKSQIMDNYHKKRQDEVDELMKSDSIHEDAKTIKNCLNKLSSLISKNADIYCCNRNHTYYVTDSLELIMCHLADDRVKTKYPSVSIDNIINDLLVASVMCDDLQKCMDELLNKYSV